MAQIVSNGGVNQRRANGHETVPGLVKDEAAASATGRRKPRGEISGERYASMMERALGVKGDDRRRHGKNYVTRVATRSRIVSLVARISRGDRDAIPEASRPPPSLVASGSACESASVGAGEPSPMSSLTFAINFPRVARRRALPTSGESTNSPRLVRAIRNSFP